MIYRVFPSRNKRLREKIGELRRRKFRVKLWHYDRHYMDSRTANTRK